MPDQSNEATKKILDNPFIELSEQARKYRRSMLACSLFCIARITGVTIKDGDVKAGYAVFTGINPAHLDWLLIGLTIYFTLMLGIYGWDSMKKWALRLKGGTNVEMWQAYTMMRLKTECLIEAAQTVEAPRGSRRDTFLKDMQWFREKYEQNKTVLEEPAKRFWDYQRLIFLRFGLLDYWGPMAFTLAMLTWMVIIIRGYCLHSALPA